MRIFSKFSKLRASALFAKMIIDTFGTIGAEFREAAVELLNSLDSIVRFAPLQKHGLVSGISLTSVAKCHIVESKLGSLDAAELSDNIVASANSSF